MYSYEKLRDFCSAVFLKIGCSEEQAATASDVLVTADARGVDSHGIARLSGYVRLWEIGRINSKPKIRVVHETPSTATVDGDKGLGLVVGPHVMKIAVEKAAAVGTGWVAVKNSNHYGIAGYHAMLALPHDMIGMAMTNASPHVAPTYSTERLLGTNPIAVAIPAGKQLPFVADFATTPVAYGKVENQQRKGEPVPLGWVQDGEGKSTTDAYATHKGGAMMPLGGDKEHGGHKGYCLGAIVDIFSAVLSGANYGPWVPPFPAYLPVPENPVGEGIGHFFGAMRVDAFRPVEEFKSHMDNWIRRFKSAKPSAGHERVYIPGEPEAEMIEKRKKEGIPLLEAVVKDLRELGEKLEIGF
jgi:LDH2 family malate/lactate/ureidoglycolate dehydrogenase